MPPSDAAAAAAKVLCSMQTLNTTERQIPPQQSLPEGFSRPRAVAQLSLPVVYPFARLLLIRVTAVMRLPMVEALVRRREISALLRATRALKSHDFLHGTSKSDKRLRLCGFLVGDRYSPKRGRCSFRDRGINNQTVKFHFGGRFYNRFFWKAMGRLIPGWLFDRPSLKCMRHLTQRYFGLVRIEYSQLILAGTASFSARLDFQIPRISTAMPAAIREFNDIKNTSAPSGRRRRWSDVCSSL